MMLKSPKGRAARVTDGYRELENYFDGILRPGESFDIIKKKLKPVCCQEITLYYIDGFVKDEISEKLFEYMIKAPSVPDITENFPYVEFECCSDREQMVKMLLSGATLLLIDGQSDGYVIDTRKYPVRGIEEPENDRVLRGPRDGFTETLIFNTALIRRRLRDPGLRMELHTIGELTQTDVALCYIDGRADPGLVEKIRKKLDGIRIGALNLGQESIAELMIGKRWYNPFPKVRYTERPDSASAMLLEGSVLIICDNSPQAMLLPTSIFDFLQESDDFYFPPLVGTYLRLVRLLVSLVTMFLTPVWYLLLQYIDVLPPWLQFIDVDSPVPIPLIVQLLIVEVTVDGLKLASLNTPSSLSNSLSVVGGLILGDFAVQVGWLVPEAILYMAMVSIANFTQPSYELGYALKFSRVLLLLLTMLGKLWGFIAGVILIDLLIVFNKTVDGGRSYLYPLIPWNGRAMKRLLFRVKLR